MSSTTPANSAPTPREDRSARRAVTIFPILVLLAGVLGWAVPGPISSQSGLITPLLGVIMFGMCLTLTLPDFTLVLTRPLPVALGIIAQYAVMPLVGCVRGGTASNVVAYLGRAATALRWR